MLLLGALGALLAPSIAAQEPRPARLEARSFDPDPEVAFSLAWRYAPDDGPGREAAAYDDSRWLPLDPALHGGKLPPGGWRGVGWFRRHLEVDRSLQGRTLAVRVEARGFARLYVDGRPVLVVGEGNVRPEVPGRRSDSAVVRFDGPVHLLAVRYEYPPRAAQPAEGIGFRLTLGSDVQQPPPGPWSEVLLGATLALPLVLAFVHLAFFSFDPRAKENLFYALEMLTFAGIVLNDARALLFPGDVALARVTLLTRGLAILAILFGGLTYYSLRTRPWPRTAWVFVAAAPLLLLACYLWPPLVQPLWILYFAAFTVDVLRLERGKRTVRREGSRFFLISFAVFGIVIGLQVLINLGVMTSVGGFRNVYIFAIFAIATGMSLYLASSLGRSRLNEAENRRRSEELARARELQLSLLPAELPRVDGLDLAASTLTATEVGGDYYDARLVDDGSLLIAFGDATGHGMSAGLVVTATKALFEALPLSQAPAEQLLACQRVLSSLRLPQLRMCLSLALVTPRALRVAVAAMPPVLLWRATSGEVEEVGAGGLPLGGRVPACYEERTAELSRGDVLLFASDGLAELRDTEDRELGYDGVAAMLRRAAAAATASEVVARLLSEAQALRAGRPLDDDLTLLVVRISGSPSPA